MGNNKKAGGGGGAKAAKKGGGGGAKGGGGGGGHHGSKQNVGGATNAKREMKQLSKGDGGGRFGKARERPPKVTKSAVSVNPPTDVDADESEEDYFDEDDIDEYGDHLQSFAESSLEASTDNAALSKKQRKALREQRAAEKGSSDDDVAGSGGEDDDEQDDDVDDGSPRKWATPVEAGGARRVGADDPRAIVLSRLPIKTRDGAVRVPGEQLALSDMGLERQKALRQMRNEALEDEEESAAAAVDARKRKVTAHTT